jgi:hypothetical protein
MKTTPSSTRQDEIAQKVAAFIYEQVTAKESIRGWFAVRWIELTIADSYAPLYEQKEELVRVLERIREYAKCCDSGPIQREAEAALEKATK